MKTMISQILAILHRSELAPLFAPGSKAEVAIAGKIAVPSGREINVSGKIDRISETSDTVYVADYKWSTPRNAEATPVSYVVQMALYRGILNKIWPNKRLKMLIVWAFGPLIVELSDDQMDLALLVLDQNQANLDAEASCS